MPVKLVSRTISTVAAGDVLIENNKNISKLLHKADEVLTPNAELKSAQNVNIEHQTVEKGIKKEQIDNIESRVDTSHFKLISLAIEVHRKFEKSAGRGQKTAVDHDKEQQLYKNCVSGKKIEDFKQYFSLFKQEKSNKTDTPTSMEKSRAMKEKFQEERGEEQGSTTSSMNELNIGTNKP